MVVCSMWTWLALACGVIHAHRLPKIHVDPITRLFQDEYGLTRIFHGVNAVTKTGSLVPSTEGFELINSLSRDDAELLSGWGFNVVRLGVLWQGVMPTADGDGNGIINGTYLDQVRKVVDLLAEKGIYTILDAHQDNLNARTCGEGIPTWLFDRMLKLANFNPTNSKLLQFPAPLPYKLPIQPDGNPLLEDCQNYQFFSEGFTFTGDAAWEALYSSPEVHEQFKRSWGAIAGAFAGVDGIIGYELLNEPMVTTESGLNDACLLPLYQKGVEGIRAHDTDGVIFYEPLVLEPLTSVVGRSPQLPEYGIEGREHVYRQAYAYHNYCFPTNDTSGVSELCHFLLDELWEGVERDLSKFKVAGFMTEFGAVGDDSQGHELIDIQAAKADEQLQSWAYWTYKSFYDITTQNPATETFFNLDGSFQMDKINRLARVYARSIAGVPISMTFNPEKKTFALEYVLKAGPTNTSTEIFLNQQGNYPYGLGVTLSPPGIAQYTFVDDTLIVTHNPSAAGQMLTVTIQ